MRNCIGILLGIAIILPVATNPASAARQRKARPEVKALLQAPTFSDCGEFTGALEGGIILNGRLYRLTSDVRIYEIGRGMVPTGTFVERRMVALSGVVFKGSEIVQQVMVRPAADVSTISSAPIRSTRIADAGPK